MQGRMDYIEAAMKDPNIDPDDLEKFQTSLNELKAAKEKLIKSIRNFEPKEALMPKSAMNSLAKCLHHLSDKDKKRMLSSIKTLSDSENIMFECALELHGSKEAREMFQTMSHVENDPVEQAYREFMDASERKSIKGTDEYERYRDVLREMDKDNVKENKYCEKC